MSHAYEEWIVSTDSIIYLYVLSELFYQLIH